MNVFFKGRFEIIKDESVVKTENVVKELILCNHTK